MSRQEEMPMARRETDQGNTIKADRLRQDLNQTSFGAISGFFKERRIGFSFDDARDQRASNVLHAPRLTDPERAAGGGGLVLDPRAAEIRLRQIQADLGTTARFPENFSRV